jgi:hypothetical protein
MPFSTIARKVWWRCSVWRRWATTKSATTMATQTKNATGTPSATSLGAANAGAGIRVRTAAERASESQDERAGVRISSFVPFDRPAPRFGGNPM